MTTLQTVALVAHTLIAILITVLVLLQRGKGADAGAGFGAGASGTVFGARGSASFFSRSTAVLAAAFFMTSLFLAYLSSQGPVASQSLLESSDRAPTEEVQDGDVGGLPVVDDEPAVDNAENVRNELDSLPSVDAGEPAAEELPSVDDEMADEEADPQ